VLKRIRENRGMTQQALADKVGVHQVTIARLERSSRNPSMRLLERIAKALKVRLTDLLK
jgi:putative transcriptional regulator